MPAGYKKVEATKYYQQKYRCEECRKRYALGETIYVNPPHSYCEKHYNELEQRIKDSLGVHFK